MVSRVRIPPAARQDRELPNVSPELSSSPSAVVSPFQLVVTGLFSQESIMTQETVATPLVATGDATAMLPVAGGRLSPIQVIGTAAIRDALDEVCLQQAVNSRCAPGVASLVLNPDAHRGYGAPVGCVLTSPTHIYPGPVGVDIKCSMSLLLMDIHGDG